MKLKYRFFFLGALILAFAVVAMRYLLHTNIPVLEPKGIIGIKELHLIVFALLLSLIVVIPVFILLFSFAWRYREGNKSAKYSPELDHSNLAEALWWLIPSAIIVVLGTVAWTSSHQLDPSRPIASQTPQMTIQVVALDWKWLFIYPQQDVASVNYIQIPVNTPVDFEITSDTVMNSFWIPQLGGQIYAMPGMSTQLHLMADQTGSFNGLSANISGEGFAGMTFVTKATSEASFNAWVRQVKHSSHQLNLAAYAQLAKPSQNNPIAYYSTPQVGLYNTEVMKYMMPATSTLNTSSAAAASANSNMSGMDMQ